MFILFTLLCLSPHAIAVSVAQSPAQNQPPAPVRDAGRVVATITVLEGTVRMTGVDVQLVSVEGNAVLAKTITDGAGEVTFADVPPGRYLLKAMRPGFTPTDSAPFDVRVGETA